MSARRSWSPGAGLRGARRSAVIVRARIAPGLWRIAALLGAVVLAVLVPAVPAQAHPRGIQVAVDFRTRVTALVPAMARVHARYVADGSRLELRNDSDQTVEVLGYQGEPMLQVRRDGVWQNTRAPSLYVDRLGTPVNPDADAHAAPQWQRISTLPIARWQDHRALWHGALPPAVRADPSHVQRVSNWRVPLLVGATIAEIAGTLDWVPPPHAGSWWAAVLLVAVAVAALGLIRTDGGTRRAGTVRVGLGGVAFVVGLVTAGYPLLVIADNADPGPASIAAALASQVLPLLVGLALITVGALALAGRKIGDLALAIAGGCAVLIGAGHAALFSHGVAPIAADGWWARLMEVVILGGGAGLVTAVVLRLRQSSSPRPSFRLPERV